MAEGTCSVKGCRGKPVGRGWCSKHYQRWKQHGDPAYVRPVEQLFCSVGGCSQPIRNKLRMLCDQHYQHWRRWGDAEFTVLTKGRVCTAEACERPVHCRHMCENHYEAWRSSHMGGAPCLAPNCDGFQYRRGLCEEHYETEQNAKRTLCTKDDCDRPVIGRGLCHTHYHAWRREENPAGSTAYRRKLAYGLEPDEFEALLARQGGVCAVCHRPPPKSKHSWNLSVDHDHKTGEIRGLLCFNCNAGIGQFKDEPERLRAAARYLEARR